jgi:DNA gyrase/topoisomerase IV subunit B
MRNLVSNIKGGTHTEGFENRVLRRIFGLKRDEVTEYLRKLHE